MMKIIYIVPYQSHQYCINEPILAHMLKIIYRNYFLAWALIILNCKTSTCQFPYQDISRNWSVQMDSLFQSKNFKQFNIIRFKLCLMSRSKQIPNPRRFTDYVEFEDKTGFSIRERGRSIEFYFDKLGGWFDESGNYYNSSGKYEKNPSKESLAFWESVKSRCNLSHHIYILDYSGESDYEDDLLREYEEGLGGANSSYGDYDDDLDVNAPDYDDLNEIIRAQQTRPFEDRPKPSGVQITRNQNPPKEERKQPSQPQSKPHQDVPRKPEPVKPEPHQQVQSQPTPQVQPVKPDVKPQVSGASKPQGPRVYIDGLTESLKDFETWLAKAKIQRNWTEIVSRVMGKETKIKILFTHLEDADAFFSSLKPTIVAGAPGGKVPYKGKNSLAVRVECD